MSLLESELELESDSDAELDVEHVEEAEVVGCDEGEKLCCSAPIINKMFGNSLSEFPPILNNLISPLQQGGGKHFKHRSMF